MLLGCQSLLGFILIVICSNNNNNDHLASFNNDIILWFIHLFDLLCREMAEISHILLQLMFLKSVYSEKKKKNLLHFFCCCQGNRYSQFKIHTTVYACKCEKFIACTKAGLQNTFNWRLNLICHFIILISVSKLWIKLINCVKLQHKALAPAYQCDMCHLDIYE